MAKSTDNPGFRELCEQLWTDLCRTTVDRFSEKVQLYPKSQFLGFVDITLIVLTASGRLTALKIRGIGVKILNGKKHLEFPAEKGANGQYYQSVFPKGEDTGGAFREVLTVRIFMDERVKAAVERAAELLAAENESPADEADDTAAGMENPFA